jgi:hypothetical protein
MRNIAAILVFASVLLISTPVLSQTWTEEEELQRFSEQVFHWGQKGESEPNNGWSAYGQLRFEHGGPQQLNLLQARGELLAFASTRTTGEVQLEAFIIPRIGLFFRSKQTTNCQPDDLEAIGIQAEMVLFFLSQAFPLGPKSVSSRFERNVAGPPTEFRFLQAAARQRGPWSAQVVAFPLPNTPAGISFEIHMGGNVLITGEWVPQGESPVVANDSPLGAWRRCWFGAMDAEGKPVDQGRADHLRSLSTFGELRKLKQ